MKGASNNNYFIEFIRIPILSDEFIMFFFKYI